VLQLQQLPSLRQAGGDSLLLLQALLLPLLRYYCLSPRQPLELKPLTNATACYLLYFLACCCQLHVLLASASACAPRTAAAVAAGGCCICTLSTWQEAEHTSAASMLLLLIQSHCLHHLSPSGRYLCE
jgi:hypothetical protein